MPRHSTRQPRSPRAVVSLSVPIDPDYTRANRAAGIRGETLAEFIREAMRLRANRILAKVDRAVLVDEQEAAAQVA